MLWPFQSKLWTPIRETIARSIIEMHGGQMQVNLQEELNQLEISFTLPIEQNKPHPE